MTLSSATKDPQACDACVQSQDCKRIRRCVKYKCKYGDGPASKTYTTPPKDIRACGSCTDSDRCIRIKLCLKHKAKFGTYEAP